MGGLVTSEKKRLGL